MQEFIFLFFGFWIDLNRQNWQTLEDLDKIHLISMSKKVIPQPYTLPVDLEPWWSLQSLLSTTFAITF
jgi:hypothetical protein